MYFHTIVTYFKCMNWLHTCYYFTFNTSAFNFQNADLENKGDSFNFSQPSGSSTEDPKEQSLKEVTFNFWKVKEQLPFSGKDNKGRDKLNTWHSEQCVSSVKTEYPNPRQGRSSMHSPIFFTQGLDIVHCVELFYRKTWFVPLLIQEETCWHQFTVNMPLVQWHDF